MHRYRHLVKLLLQQNRLAKTQRAKRKEDSQQKSKIIANEPFSTAERSERVENLLFRATREYTEAGIEQAIVAMQRLGANIPDLRKRAVRE